ncbi:unnamed protein product [Alopecurus aequalis]
MSGKARMLCALLMVLLCLAAHFQGACCRGGHGGGHGGGGGGHGGGGGGGHGGSGGGRGAGGFGSGGGGSRGGSSGRGRPWTFPFFFGSSGSQSHNNRRSAATEPRDRGVWRFSGAAAALAAAGLIWWR